MADGQLVQLSCLGDDDGDDDDGDDGGDDDGDGDGIDLATDRPTAGGSLDVSGGQLETVPAATDVIGSTDDDDDDGGGEDECTYEFVDDVLVIHAPTAELIVTATGSTGETDECRLDLCAPPCDGDDDDGDGDDDDGDGDSI